MELKAYPLLRLQTRLDAEQAEKDISDEEWAIRERQPKRLSKISGLVIREGREDKLRYNILRIQKGR